MTKEQFEKILNTEAWNLPQEYLRKALPCDGCGRKPIVNPKWLTEDNDWYLDDKNYILGCPTAMWGFARGWETLEEAIENWNYHVERGNHVCR